MALSRAIETGRGREAKRLAHRELDSTGTALPSSRAAGGLTIEFSTFALTSVSSVLSL
jgi:hypothetical protein